MAMASTALVARGDPNPHPHPHAMPNPMPSPMPSPKPNPKPNPGPNPNPSPNARPNAGSWMGLTDLDEAGDAAARRGGAGLTGGYGGGPSVLRMYDYRPGAEAGDRLAHADLGLTLTLTLSLTPILTLSLSLTQTQTRPAEGEPREALPSCGDTAGDAPGTSQVVGVGVP